MIDLLNLFRARGAATISLEAPVFEKFRPSLPDREPPSPHWLRLRSPRSGARSPSTTWMPTGSNQNAESPFMLS